MHEFELRPTGNGQRLSGGPLEGPLDFEQAEYAIRVVGYLSQRQGSVLRIYDAEGAVIDTQHRKPSVVLVGAVGGLVGPQ